MKGIGGIVFVYGLLLLGGGFMGYVHAGSRASLLSGIIFGAIILASAVAMMMGKVKWAWVALVTTFFLDAFFTYRFIKTQSFMPSGLMSLVSLVMLVILALSMRTRSAK